MDSIICPNNSNLLSIVMLRREALVIWEFINRQAKGKLPTYVSLLFRHLQERFDFGDGTTNTDEGVVEPTQWNDQPEEVPAGRAVRADRTDFNFNPGRF